MRAKPGQARQNPRVERWVGMLLLLLLFLAGAAYSLTTSATEDFNDLILRPLYVAAGLVILCTASMWIKQSPWYLTDFNPAMPMGLANWSFGNSWASTLTVFGAVLTGLLAPGVQPAGTPGYPVLGLLFGVLVVVAPLVYNAFRTYNANTRQPEGYISCFLVASIVTLWAVMGQLAAMRLLAANMAVKAPVTSLVADLLKWIFVAAAVLVLFYGWNSIRSTVQQQIDADNAARLATTPEAEMGMVPGPAEPPRPRPTWSLL